MSDHWWIKSLAGGLVILMLGIASSKGNVEECSLCCTLQETIEDLNCTWSNNSSLELNAILQKITKPHDFPRNYTIPPGRKWLLIPRENLIKSLKYQLIINGGTWMETLTFTYCHGCENVLIGAPVLHSSISEEDDTLVVDVKWENQDSLAVELRYRILGASEWILVHSNDQEPDCYRMRDPEPYTDYEFQIRYIPNEHQKSSSLWSTSYVLTTVPIGTLDIWRRMEQGNLLVTWKPLSPYNNKGKIFSYKVTYDYNNKLQTTEKPCCSIILPAPSTNVCVSARNSTGLGPVTCITPLCSVVANMDDFGGKAWGDPSGGIAVWWKESLNYGFPVNYVVEWRKENSTEMDWTRSQKAGQTVVLPGEFTPGVLYLISIHALYKDSCVIVFSSETYSREEVPLAAPVCSIRVLSSSDVFISWDEIPRHTMRGNLKHYTIYVNSTTSSQRHIVLGRNMTLSGLSPNTMYHTYITASTSAGEGVPSAGHTFQTKGDWNLTLPLVSLVGVGILMVIFMLPHVRKNLPVLWPKIPKPEIKLDEYFTYIKVWDPTQTPSNPPITEVEEMEPLSPLPDPCRPIISGYEKRSLDISGNPESTSTPHITEKKRSELLPPLLPPPSPSPDRCRPITSGYEKHFMPTLEEVMGSC